MRDSLLLSVLMSILGLTIGLAIMAVANLACSGGGVVEAANSAASTNYFPPGPVTDGWPANAVLIYCGTYNDTGLTRIHFL